MPMMTTRDDLLLAEPVARGAGSGSAPSPRCGGALCKDSLDLADIVCVNCGERYDSALAPLRRAPTENEKSACQRYIYARTDRR